jgi:imidazolonepropionase
MATVITNIGQLVTPLGIRPARGGDMGRLRIVEEMEILVDDRGAVEAIERSVPRSHDDRIIDAHGCIVIPGFVDAHTHAVFARGREAEFLARARGVPYDGGGILASSAHLAGTSRQQLIEHARPFLGRMLAHGTTTAEVKSGYGLSTEGEIKQLRAIAELATELPLRIVSTFLGAHSFPPDIDREAYLSQLTEEMLPRVAHERLACFCDVFCDRGFYTVDEARRILNAARDAGLGLKLHADELADTGGAALAAELQAVSADHLIRASEEGLRRLAEAGVVAVLLPGTSFTLGAPYAPARVMIERGVAVAVATDFNPGSCPIYAMPLIFSLAVTRLGLTVEETLTATTLNAAAALGLAETVGSIEVGKAADLLILNLETLDQLPYYFGHNPVARTVIGGRIAWESSP